MPPRFERWEFFQRACNHVERVFPKQPIFGFSKSVTMFFKETKLSRGKVVNYLLDQYLVEK